MKYEAEIDLRNTNTSHTLLVELVGRDRRVLDVGCAAGDLGRALRRRGCRVAGVELDPAAAEAARSALDEVLTGDVGELDLVGHFGKESFDVVVLGDVLEHLPDPVAALRRLQPLLAPEGSVVASIPNVAHGAVRLALLAGRFDYRPLGLLDSTHLRFFTRASVYETFREAGLVPVDVRRTTAGVFETEIGVRREDYDQGVVDAVEGDPESTTYQFVLRAVPEDSAEAGAVPLPTGAGRRADGARIGLFARWRPDDVRTALAVRVAHAELTRRLPGSTVRVFATGPGAGPSAHDGGLAVEVVEEVAADGWERLAGELDCVVVTGDDPDAATPSPGPGPECPVVWSAVPAGDAAAPAGGPPPAYAAFVAERPRPGGYAGAPDRVPDPLLLVPRLLPPDALARRLHLVRMMGWFPAQGPAVVVEAGERLLPDARAVGRALDAVVDETGASVVLAPALGCRAGGEECAGAVAAAMEAPAYRLPADAVAEDVVAVISQAAALAACSPAAAAVGLAYGVPAVPVNRVGEDLPGALAAAFAGAPEGDGGRAAVEAALDAHYDRVAAIAEVAAAARPGPVGGAVPPAEYVAAMDLAHRRMRQRLAAERLAVADHLGRHDGELLAVRARAERLAEEASRASAGRHACEAELARARAELEALRNTRVLRLLRPARAVYARLRGGRL
ncbi:MAG: methyltransferase domain-containing protein [Acidimicrobiia bacterium]